MRGARKIVVVSVSALLGAYVMVAATLIGGQDAQSLVLCADKGGWRIPFDSFLCRQYLFRSRIDPRDVADVQHAGGGSFLIQIEDEALRENVLRTFVERGLDLNQLDERHGGYPLHAAVLFGDTEAVRLLLDHGARIDVVEAKHGLTPLQMARRLAAESSDSTDRSEMIRMLGEAERR